MTVRVTPRAHRESLNLQNGQLRVRLRAAPVDGAANTALITLLADRLKLPRSALTIIHGETARIKRIAITGATEDVISKRLTAALAASEPG